MFGISGFEFIFVLVIILMLFGSKEIPQLARTLGRIIQQVKNATNELKTEINKSAGLDDILQNPIQQEIDQAKEALQKPLQNFNPVPDNIQKLEEDIDQITGPIKRGSF